MNDNIEITQEQAKLFIRIVGDFPNGWENKDDVRIDINNIGKEDYEALMDLYDHLYEEIR